METVTTARSLDRRGKTITTFVAFDAAAELRTMNEGDVLELVTEAYEPIRSDIESWCRAIGHEFISSEATESGFRFLIEKRTPKTKDSKLAMIISVSGLEELLSPLGFALAAALEDIEVSLYIQGPAVRVLSQGFRPKLKGWARPFSRFAAAQMTASGHIPAQEKLGQLRSLGGTIYMCGPSMQAFKVSRDDLIFDDLEIVEYLTFMSIMESADIHLFV